MFLISGGKNDPNLKHLAKVCQANRIVAFVHYIDDTEDWNISWSLDKEGISINGHCLTPTALFVRWNAFGYLEEKTNKTYHHASEWFDAIKGWALANSDVKVLNNLHDETLINKPAVLGLAQEAGLTIPKTCFTNDLTKFEPESWILKPITGGAYTQVLKDPIKSDRPWIVQERLIDPELRLFRIGNEYIAFRIESDNLDYRATDNINMKLVEIPTDLREGLQKLTDRLGLDYAAADFKTCPKTGQLKFLEVNSMPMFYGFDIVSKGRVTDALLRHLLPVQFNLKH